LHPPNVSMPTTCHINTRNMDLFMYVLYARDHCFVKDMVYKVAVEVAELHQCCELLELVQTHSEQQELYVALFFLLLNLHTPFRHWALTTNEHRLPAICEHKAASFLLLLKKSLVPAFLVDECMDAHTFLRNVKIEYIRA